LVGRDFQLVGLAVELKALNWLDLVSLRILSEDLLRLDKGKLDV